MKKGSNAALRVAGWGLAVFAATRLASAVLESTSMAASVAQAVMAEWGAGRLGVTWSDPDAPEATAGAMATRAGKGAAVGIGIAALVTGILVATRAAIFERAGAGASILLVGLVTAGLRAMVEELLLHGVTLRALVDVESVTFRAVACGVTSAGLALGEPDPTVRTVLVAGVLGVLYGALWIRDRGAWMAWGAHAGWLFATESLLRGGVTDMRIASSAWAGADAGLAGGWAALFSVLPAAAFALRWARKGPGEP